eukprot:2229318-Ditylum_brightwellii.AAC.1
MGWELASLVSQCSAEAVDTGSVPMEDSVKCVALETGKIYLSANQMYTVGLGTQCMICNCLIGE